MPPNNLITDISYIARSDIYKKQKPYAADFLPTRKDTKQTNHVYDTKHISIQHLIYPEKFDLNTNGFCVIKIDSQVPVKDVLNRTSEVELACFAELEAVLHRRFPEYARIESMNLTVRSRDTHFHFPTDDDFKPVIVSHEQPATIPHVDFSSRGIDTQIGLSFPGQLEHFQGKDYDVLTCWRPLIGPNDDWPLALCDAVSVAEDDVIHNDDIHRDRVYENTLLHPNEGHQWYYIEGQMPEDLLVFRNADSHARRPQGFHCAVNNPLSKSPLRQSLEIRVVAIR